MPRTVKSCGPDASTPASRFAAMIRKATVAESPITGEHEGNRKTIAQGMPDRLADLW
jgi:hypothetical protein